MQIDGGESHKKIFDVVNFSKRFHFLFYSNRLRNYHRKFQQIMMHQERNKKPEVPKTFDRKIFYLT